MIKRSVIVLLILIILLFNLTGLAENQQTDQLEDGIYGDEITVITSNDTYEVVAEGNALLLYQEIKITGNKAQYNTNTRDIRITGVVRFENPDYQITAEKMNGNLKEQRFSLTGNVNLTGQELTLTGQSLEYQPEADQLKITGKPELKFKDIMARAETIIYHPETGSAVLEGDVRGQRAGQSFAGESLKLDLNQGKIILSGQAKLLFSDEGEN